MNIYDKIYDYVGLYMTMYSIVLLCIGLHDCVWLYMTVCAYVWQSMAL